MVISILSVYIYNASWPSPPNCGEGREGLPMNRRYFLTSLSATGVLLVLPQVIASCSTNDRHLRYAVPQTLLSVCDTPTLLEIGRGYLAMFPEENDINVLLALITRGLPANNGNSSGELLNKITEEFENGQVVEVNGWLLSLTETRQCALYSLVGNN